MATGDILFEFAAPVQARGNGRAIAFDGQFLYLTKLNRFVPDRKIFKLTTSGTFVSSVTTRIQYGALKYDFKENVFWAGGYENTYEIDKIDINGNVLQTFNYSTFPLNPNDPSPGYIDGITINPDTDTILFSSDHGVSIYNMDKTGNLLNQFGTPPLLNKSHAESSGVESDGVNLWINVLTPSETTGNIVETTTKGTEILRFPSNTCSYIVEDIDFDDVTFAPKCVLWTNEATFGVNRIRAWEIPCPDLCPEPNPQTCCQVVVEHKTQLVPPAKAGTAEVIDKDIVAKIEKVCAEKVIICGVIKKTIRYTAVVKGRELPNHIIKDEVPFECFIDRDDANCGDKFVITGKTVLCDIFERETNFCSSRDVQGRDIILAFRFVEKDIIKICIRKRPGSTALNPCNCNSAGTPSISDFTDESELDYPLNVPGRPAPIDDDF